MTAFYEDKLLSKGNIKHSTVLHLKYRINGVIILGRGFTISNVLGVIVNLSVSLAIQETTRKT
jgi:hypothetical protein